MRVVEVLFPIDHGRFRPDASRGGGRHAVLALFGPTTEEWGFFPAGPKDRVLESQLDCRPCTLHGKKHCDRNHACMQSITPEQVMRALDE